MTSQSMTSQQGRTTLDVVLCTFCQGQTGLRKPSYPQASQKLFHNYVRITGVHETHVSYLSLFYSLFLAWINSLTQFITLWYLIPLSASIFKVHPKDQWWNLLLELSEIHIHLFSTATLSLATGKEVDKVISTCC